MADFKYTIIEKLGILSENNKGWTRQLNLISWNDHPAKYDIRDWAPQNQKMGKGITLSKEELVQLKGILNRLEGDLD